MKTKVRKKKKKQKRGGGWGGDCDLQVENIGLKPHPGVDTFFLFPFITPISSL